MTPHCGPIETPRRSSHLTPPSADLVADAPPAAVGRRNRWADNTVSPEALAKLRSLYTEDELSRLAHEAANHRGRKMTPRKARKIALRAQRRHGKIAKRVAVPHDHIPPTPAWRRLRRATLLCGLIATAELALAMFTAPQFSVRDVTSDAISVPDATLAMAQSKLAGQNWLTADTTASLAQLRALPEVKSASVRRELTWPPRLHIAVTERQPFARVSGPDGWWVVDSDGVPFRKVSEGDANLYAISSRALNPAAGKPLPGDAWKTAREFAAVLDANGQDKAAWKLRAIYFDEHGFASLRLNDTSSGAAPGDSILVHLGNSQWEKKLVRAQQALRWLAASGHRAAALSLVSYRRPIWTPRGAVEPQSTATGTA